MNLIQYKVTGKVQGVGFRDFTQREANKLGVKGWCHNHPDESVQGVAIASEDVLAAFRKRLEAGPPSSQVKSVQVLKESSGLSEEDVRSELGDHKGYSVRRYRAE